MGQLEPFILVFQIAGSLKNCSSSGLLISNDVKPSKDDPVFMTGIPIEK
jgi:hypothetical protein